MLPMPRVAFVPHTLSLHPQPELHSHPVLQPQSFELPHPHPALHPQSVLQPQLFELPHSQPVLQLHPQSLELPQLQPELHPELHPVLQPQPEFCVLPQPQFAPRAESESIWPTLFIVGFPQQQSLAAEPRQPASTGSHALH